jgi:hypothetical protein
MRRLYRRFAETRLVEALSDTPVVLIHGPRQCGKTTLARMAGRRRGFAYFTFDDDVVLAGARADPIGFVAALVFSALTRVACSSSFASSTRFVRFMCIAYLRRGAQQGADVEGKSRRRGRERPRAVDRAAAP